MPRTATLRPVTLTGLVCHRRPVCPCEILPRGLAGLVTFNGGDYLLSYHADLPAEGEPIIHGYRLTNAASGATYDLDAASLVCDCPDATYRGRACKHTLAVADLRRQGDLL